ncbi:hypothetical protein VSS37_18030 [Candidatus Thiothrix sp. Deng01]|uniref:Sel1 repeat family protein n=1 Tax=Candidatus Thiothrix phosphatis TaxID=3112415 RepID=A0ABU6D2H1_9GAMM|nr:hypothetical protein [Candidatus Thiothrix sp. Deng01]MEB4592883.1 hypothetical protein [Candidatus Thiothrix sp. Deng01]
MTKTTVKRWIFSLFPSPTLLLGVACSLLSTHTVAASNDIAQAIPVSMNEAPPPWSGPGAGAAVPTGLPPIASVAAPASGGVENWYRNRRRSMEKPTDELGSLQAAAQAGDANAQYRLAMLLRSSDNPQANIAQSIKWQQSAAEAGNAEAQYGLGLLYANGQYVASDSNKAREWFQKAADQGYVAARLAMLSLNNGAPALAVATSGRLRNAAAEEQLASAPAPTPVLPAPPESAPVPMPMPPAPPENVPPPARSPDTEQLAALQLEAEPEPATPAGLPSLTPKFAPTVDPASRPEPVAMTASLQTPNNAGASSNMDMTGIEPAVLRQSAEAGDKQAQLMLGTMYEDGVNGLPSDLREAAYWYEQAARQDYPKAQYNLGLLYEDGRGVTQNFKQAAYWYDKAAKAGFSEAQNNLGVLFVLGNGVKKDPKRAAKLFTDSASQGNADAQRNLDMLRNN